jgi:hypothetical protein
LYGNGGALLIQELIYGLWTEVFANAACIAAAADCDGVFSCMHGGEASPGCTLPDASLPAFPSGCDGSDVTICVNVIPTDDSGREVLVPCRGGRICRGISGVFAGCFLPDCTTTDPDPVCRDGDIDQCILAGVHANFDCDVLSRGSGGTCEMVDDGSGTGTMEPACVPTGAACDETTYTPSCSGTSTMRCALGHEYPTDCSDIQPGWSCNPTNGECIPDVLSWECTVPDRGICDCDDILFCDPTVGHDVRIPCADLDLRTCEDSGAGVHCIP